MQAQLATARDGAGFRALASALGYTIGGEVAHVSLRMRVVWAWLRTFFSTPPPPGTIKARLAAASQAASLVGPAEAREARLIPLRGAAYLVAALLLAVTLLAVRVRRQSLAAAQATAHVEARLVQAVQLKDAVLSPWLEEMAHDLLRVVHGYAVPRGAAKGEDERVAADSTCPASTEAGQWVDEYDEDGEAETAKERLRRPSSVTSPAWLSAAQRELDGATHHEEAAPAEGEEAPKNNGKQSGKHNGKRK